MKLATRLLLSLGVAALLLGLLMGLGGVTPSDVLAALSDLSPKVYLLALGLHALTYIARAARFRVLLPRPIRPGLRRMLVTSAAHNMASYLLPAKTGEASFVIYNRLYCGVPTSRGLAGLLVARFLDGAALSLCLAIAALVLHSSGDYARLDWLGLLAGGLVAVSGFFLFAALRGDLFTRLLRRFVRLLKLHRYRFGRSLSRKLFTLGQSLEVAGRRGRLAAAFALTVPMCVTIYGFYWILARDMGMPDSVGLAEATFGSTCASFTNLLPINGAAGVGTQELGWVTGFHEFLGFDYELALSTGIGVHFVQLANILGFGLVAHLVMGVSPRLVLEANEEVELRTSDPKEEASLRSQQ